MPVNLRRWLKIINLIIAVALTLIFFLIELKYGNKTTHGKQTLKKCDDPTIVSVFNRMNISGVQFMESLLEQGNYTTKYKLKVGRKRFASSGGSVRSLPKGITLGKDFLNPITVDSFGTCLHEYKHVQDYKLCLAKELVFLPSLVLMLIILLGQVNTVFDKLIKQATNITIHTFILKHDALLTFLFVLGMVITAILSIIIERRAIGYVPEASENVLKQIGYSSNEIESIKSYLKNKSVHTLVWYTASIISFDSLFVSVVFWIKIFYKIPLIFFPH